MRHTPWLPLLLLLVADISPAQRRRYTQDNESGGVLLAEEAAYDVESYDLTLRVDPAKERIDGTLRMLAKLVENTDAIVLDLDERLKVEAVSFFLPGSDRVHKARYRQRDGQIRITLDGQRVGSLFGTSVRYGGEPRKAPKPPWDGGFTWEKTADGSPWIATSCQGEGADVWWPCKDHPSDEPRTMDLHVTVPKPLVVASNGRLLGVSDAHEQGWHTYDWRVSTPINNYGVALNIAPYEVIKTQFESVAGDTFDFIYWVLPENKEQGEKVFEEFQRQMRFFEDVCGPYPFRADKYGVAETPHLGMEHQSIIAYGHQYRGDPDLGYDYDWLHHHELSHEWWGNMVTARDWKDYWIHEGVGTYTQALYLERRFGPEAYRAKMLHDLKRVKNRGTVAPRDPRTTQEMYFSSNREDAPDIDVYMKGSWICHSLRWLLGDETFFRVLRRWAYPDPGLEATTDGSACRFVDTDELLAIAEQHSGVELDWFFELYLRQPELPELEVKKRGRRLLLRWETPEDLAFPMPVEVQVGDQRVRVEVPAGGGSVEVGRKDFDIDPDSWLLMKR